jgi:signal transduction histidine kinase
VDVILIGLLFLDKYWSRAKSLWKEERRANNMLKYISHEVNNPLNVIHHLLAYATEALQNPSTEGIDSAIADLRIASSQCEFMEHIASDILTIQKLEAGEMHMYQKLCLIEDVMSDMQHSIMQKSEENNGVTIEFIFSKKLQVVVDSVRLRQILLNYLTNAMKFTSAGYIKVITQEHENYIMFSVEDTGQGIPQKDQPRIFEAFTHIASSGRHGNNGLGLYLVRLLAEHMEGRVGFTSSPSGSTFWFELPKVQLSEKSSDDYMRTVRL